MSSAEEKAGRLVVGAGACVFIRKGEEGRVTCGGPTDGHTWLAICWATALVCFEFGAEGDAATDRECPPVGECKVIIDSSTYGGIGEDGEN